MMNTIIPKIVQFDELHRTVRLEFDVSEGLINYDGKGNSIDAIEFIKMFEHVKFSNKLQECHWGLSSGYNNTTIESIWYGIINFMSFHGHKILIEISILNTKYGNDLMDALVQQNDKRYVEFMLTFDPNSGTNLLMKNIRFYIVITTTILHFEGEIS